jgi:4,5-dihydroxyphthalate decarboxylase
LSIPLVIATSSHQQGLVQALVDGRVALPGCEARFVSLTPGDSVLLTRTFDDPEFNVAELSLSKYVSLHEAGDCPYIAIPVFIARSFRHGDIYVRTDRGIRSPADLRGRRVGTGDFRHTAHVWVRALLEEDYGVRPSDVRWVVGHREKPYEPGADMFVPPRGVSIETAPAGLSQMLESGEIDALLSPLTPSCVTRNAPDVGQLFTDPEAAALEHFSRTGLFPILHVMGVRKELVERHPGLPDVLLKAFTQAKDDWLASSDLSANRTARAMGGDFYAYGLGSHERAALNTFLAHHHRQGLSGRQLAVEELFTPIGSPGPTASINRDGAGVGSILMS